MLKKTLFILSLLAIILSITACGNETSISDAHSDFDIDLTELSNTMVYAEVYNMLDTPEDYIGKMIRMNGQFAVYQDPSSGNIYYILIIADATACCTLGMEFVLTGTYNYPDDYPEPGTELTVTGTFQTYEENGKLYCHLTDAVMN